MCILLVTVMSFVLYSSCRRVLTRVAHRSVIVCFSVSSRPPPTCSSATTAVAFSIILPLWLLLVNVDVGADPALEGEHELLEGDGAVLVKVELLYPLIADRARRHAARLALE
jgi:hypothetical protein